MTDRYLRISLSFLKNLFCDYEPRNFAVRFWDGSTWDEEPGIKKDFILILKHPGALRSMFLLPNDLSLGEAYIHDDFDIEGDIEAVYPLALHLYQMAKNTLRMCKLISLLLSLPANSIVRSRRRAVVLKGKKHTIERDHQAISYHYDVPAEFYKLWLDTRMTYSCAYFNSLEEDLDAAQERKLEYICRKLRLKPDEKLLDIGCGWGSLVIYAVKNYGVDATGITLSKAQFELANRFISDAGLSSRCRVEWKDYRQLDETEKFDKLVSVGMIEHVGEEKLPLYFKQAWKLLKPGGVFLNHGIACMVGGSGKPLKFREKYVFPDGKLLPVSTTVRIAEEAGFEVRDVESLREHYALTLRSWLHRLEKNREKACEIAGDLIYRIWRLFISASAFGFDRGWLNIYQVLLVKNRGGRSELPLTRKDWYK